MDRASVVHLFDYMYWVNLRLLDEAARLASEQFTAPSASTTRDLRATLVHELDVEWSWRLSLQGSTYAQLEAEGELRAEDYPNVQVLRDHWQHDEAAMRGWLDGLTEEQVAAELTPSLSNRPLPLWQFLLHIVVHATQQQSDAATLLSALGHSPGDLGYLEWLADRAR
jgi:uncharacterized damage-inducible protein DinB